MVVRGDLAEGDEIEFYVNGVRAECPDPATGEWVDTYPFEIGGFTELNLRTEAAEPTPGPSPTPTPTPGTSAFRLYLPVLIKHNLEQIARLFIEKGVSHSFAQPCDTISYTIVYGNIGAATVSGTVIVDRIPRHTSLVKGSITDGGEESERTITWNVGTLSPEEDGSVSYSVTIDEEFSGYVVNVADVDSEQTESLTSDPALTQVALPTILTAKPWPTETPTSP